jgi:hypothetical protein
MIQKTTLTKLQKKISIKLRGDYIDRGVSQKNKDLQPLDQHDISIHARLATPLKHFLKQSKDLLWMAQVLEEATVSEHIRLASGLVPAEQTCTLS